MTTEQFRGSFVMAFLLAVLGFSPSAFRATPELPALPPEAPRQQRKPPAQKLTPQSVDLNTTDSLQLLRLPGAGPKTTHRILNRRRVLGFFAANTQLLEVHGIGEKTYARWDSFLTPKPSVPLFAGGLPPRLRIWAAPLNLNAIQRDTLYNAGILPARLARKLLAARNRKGGFATWAEVWTIQGFAPIDQRRVAANFYLGPVPKLDLNAARIEELESLPGIGPKTAAAIVADRTANGPFTSVSDLQRVRGIGPKTVEKLRPRLQIVLPRAR